MDHLDSIWAEYQSTRGAPIRDRLVLQYSPLVKFVAGRACRQEATSTALEALVGAVEDYDGAGRFEAFAMQRMAEAFEPVEVDVAVW